MRNNTTSRLINLINNSHVTHYNWSSGRCFFLTPPNYDYNFEIAYRDISREFLLSFCGLGDEINLENLPTLSRWRIKRAYKRAIRRFEKNAKEADLKAKKNFEIEALDALLERIKS